jgi:hypothetical protein
MDFTEYGPNCPGSGWTGDGTQMSEDCLTVVISVALENIQNGVKEGVNNF